MKGIGGFYLFKALAEGIRNGIKTAENYLIEKSR